MSQIARLEERFQSLPPEARRQVLDFMAFLEQRYHLSVPRPRPQKSLRSYAFVGQWRERKEMQDSHSWVRDLRRQEWHE
jgi:hypothetical protein